MFSFLRQSPRQEAHPIEQLAALREYTSDLPSTKAVFKLSDTPLQDHHHLDKFLVMVGSWRVPDRLGNNRQVQAVNPNYEHRSEYSDAAAVCECGAVTTSTSGSVPECRLATCNSLYRSEVVRDVWQRRASIIDRTLKLGQSNQYLAARLDLKGPRNVSRVLDELNIDGARLREQAKTQQKQLIRDLGETFPTTTLAAAFGKHRNTIRKWQRADG